MGMAYISDNLARILIKPRATFSFMETTYAMHIGLKSCKLNEPIVVSMPMGTSVVCENIYKDILVEMGGNKIKWDFISLPISEFNTILGMDGLSQYKVKVDCSEKTVELEGENRERIIFLGDKWKSTTRIISAMMAMKCLRKGCNAYLVFVIDKEK